MPWNSTWPVGNVSVKVNRTSGQQNTTYIETTMGNSVVGTNTTSTRDHFWNVGSNEDGRHRFIQSPGFTVGGNPADPVIGTGMSGVIYLRTVSVNEPRKEIFYREGLSSQIYQVSPSYLTGTVNIGSSYVNVIAVPANTYGEIFMYSTTEDGNSDVRYSTQTGFFRSNATLTYAWAYTNITDNSRTSNGLEFLNKSSDVNSQFIRARVGQYPTGKSWKYKITYRAI